MSRKRNPEDAGTPAVRPLADVIAEMGPRAGLDQSHVHDVAAVRQSHIILRAEEALQRAAAADDPREADAQMASALSSIKALLVAAAGLSHVADSVLSGLGRPVPPWLKQIEGVVDQLGSAVGGA